MRDLLLNLSTAIVSVILLKFGIAAVDLRLPRPRPIPVAAIVLFGAVAVPSMLQVIWPSILPTLRMEPELVRHHGEVWRLATALFVQDGGIWGAAFNLVFLAAFAALGAWFWGGLRMVAIFLAFGVALNLEAAAFDVAEAGNSGAMLALGATIAGYVAVRGQRSARLLALVPVGLAGLAWAVLSNYHGIAVVAGALIGAVFGLVGARTGHREPANAR